MPRSSRVLPPVAMLCALALVGIPASADAAPLPLPGLATDAALARKMAAVLDDPRVTNDRVGVVVADAASGTQLYGRSATSALTPASNLKLVTAAAALDVLGPNHTFGTQVYAPAAASGGVVSRLYLRGGGDPTLRESDLKALAAQVKSAGITKVTGGVVGDGGYFDADRYGNYWDGDDYNYYYAPQIAGLTLAPTSDLFVGTVQITYRPGSSSGDRATIGVVPALAKGFVRLVNRTRTTKAGTGAAIGVRRTPGTNTITVSGRVARKRSTASRTVTISNPAAYAAHVFTRVLRAAGIDVPASPTTGTTPSTRVQVAKDSSVALSTIVHRLLKRSNNGIAEHLVKTIGRVGSKAGTWSAGAAAVRRWLAGTQTLPSTVTIVDGSGLAHRNKLTARVVVRLLRHVQDKPWFSTFHAALPLAGNPDPMIGGTLADRMRGTRAQNNLRAKTGTLSGVTALSGYVTDRSGRRYVFAQLGNYRGSTPRPVFDQLGAALAGWTS